MLTKLRGRWLLWVPCVLTLSCGVEVFEQGNLPEGEDLPLGDVPELKADGTYGHALECKTIPSLTPLPSPEITLSIDGLTLHLQDKTTGFSKVYPIGAGVINNHPGETTYGQSLSMYPPLVTHSDSFQIVPSTVNPCRIWWTDSATGETSPVFAGLPFMSWYGAYGIHGPVTDYWMESGGRLKRGYVSHGCIRMEGDDVAEVYAYIKAAAKVPVKVQQAIERDATGKAVDVDQRWILSECSADADCNYTGGVCKKNAFSGRGFCTARCSQYCDYDKYGYPVTFCVDDPEDKSSGYCTYKSSDFNHGCQRYDGFTAAKGRPRFNQSSVTADVCLPGGDGDGWIGDRCQLDDDCMTGLDCQKAAGDSFGYCTQTCSLYCPDKAGYAGTFCVEGTCRAKCSASSACPAGFTCVTRARYNDPATSTPVCIPAASSGSASAGSADAGITPAADAGAGGDGSSGSEPY